MPLPHQPDGFHLDVYYNHLHFRPRSAWMLVNIYLFPVPPSAPLLPRLRITYSLS